MSAVTSLIAVYAKQNNIRVKRIKRRTGKRMTLDQAIREASKRGAEDKGRVYSCFKSENVTRAKSGRRLGRAGVWRHNLTTDTAVGFTNRRDWQSKAMAMGPAFAFATATGTSTATSATTMTNTGASFPTAGQGLAGQLVVSANRYAVIVSNSATVLTLDQWYDPTSTSGAAGSTPATGTYVILPGQNPASWMALTQDAVAPAATDTTLATELAASGFTRAVGTYSHTAAASTYSLQHLFTASGTATINKEAIFGAANVTGGGVMPFESAEPSPPTLVSGDTLTQTCTVTIN